MAWSASLATSLTDNVDRSSYTVASWTPVASRVYLVWVSYFHATAAVQPTMSGNSMTWEHVRSAIAGTAQGASLFIAYSGASPSTGTTTIDFGGDTHIGCIVHIVEVDGAYLGGASAIDAVVQHRGTSQGGVSSPLSLDFTNPVIVGSRCFSGWSSSTNQAMTPRTNWTELGDHGHGTPSNRLETQWRSDASEQTTSVSGWTGTAAFRGVIVEIKEQPQSVVVSGVGSSEVFGSPTLTAGIVLLVSAIASAQEFGTAHLLRYLVPSATGSGEVFGTSSLLFSIAPTGIGSGEAEGSPTLHQRILMAALSSSEDFGTLRLVGFILPTAIGSEESEGAPSVILALGPSGIGTETAFGTSIFHQRILMEGLMSTEAFGTTGLGLPLTLSGIPSDEAWATPSLALRLLLAGLVSDLAFGTTQFNQRIYMESTGSSEAFGVTFINRIQTLILSGIGSLESVANPHLQRAMAMAGIGSAEAFGTTHLARLIIMSGIASSLAFGATIVKVTQFVLPEGILSAQALGVPQLNLRLLMAGISSAQTFGVLTVRGPILFLVFPQASATAGVLADHRVEGHLL